VHRGAGRREWVGIALPGLLYSVDLTVLLTIRVALAAENFVRQTCARTEARTKRNELSGNQRAPITIEEGIRRYLEHWLRYDASPGLL
jgi:hypothetical protein